VTVHQLAGRKRGRPVLAVAGIAGAAITGVLYWQGIAPPPRPASPKRLSAAGAQYAAEVAWLAAHPARVPASDQAGILVASSSPAYRCWGADVGLAPCRTWHGTVVLASGQMETLSSGKGRDAAAALVHVGDEVEFPASVSVAIRGVGDWAGWPPDISVIVRRAVSVP